MLFGIRALFFAYSVVMEAIVWLVLVPTTWLRTRTRATRDAGAWREHLARVPSGPTAGDAGAVLIHAVSVGEMHAVAPLVAALSAQSRRIVLTSGTAAGLDAARRLAQTHSAIVGIGWLPWDRRAVHAWLSARAPSCVVVVETELWPNLFRACADLDIPLVIVNGRVRPRDVPRYRWGRAFFRHVLACATWIGVQSDAERERFVAIGAPRDRVVVAGNLKFDAALMAATTAPSTAAGAGPTPLVVAGSTHAPEERWLLECARQLAERGLPVRLVLAPRHITRAEEIVRVASARGMRVFRGADDSADDWDVLVVDTYGTLNTWYAAADVVVMGGTFVPVGGHNILEPAALGRPIVVGPHTEEIASLLTVFDEAGAIMRVTSADRPRGLADACASLLTDRANARIHGARAFAACQRGSGAAARYAAAIAEQIDARS